MTTKHIVNKAKEAYTYLNAQSGEKKAHLLETIAKNIEAAGDALLNIASAESNLPLARITGERGRTCGQLRLFANKSRTYAFANASIDTAIPERAPLPKPDIRKCNKALGPILIFGASNFPLAFSTAGGDTASALAAGCSVIYKHHPAHLETSKMVADIIDRSLAELGMPSSVFQHIESQDFDYIKELVSQDALAGIAFTGSYHGGMSILDYAKARVKPIPVFTEMGSVNPILYLGTDNAIQRKQLAEACAASITQGIGQFCTKPGLIFGLSGSDFQGFVQHLQDSITKIMGGDMLTHGIKQNYIAKLEKSLSNKGIKLLTSSSQTTEGIHALPCLGMTDATAFLSDENLHEEVFGPYALVVECQGKEQLSSCADVLGGQLTATMFGSIERIAEDEALIAELGQMAGRVIINNVPTGVEVCDSMVHGGPFPATTDMRYTSVGSDAVLRWLRPVAYQNFPDKLLPPELQNDNPHNIVRLVNGKLTSEKVSHG